MRLQVQPIGNKRYFGGKNQENSHKITIFAIFCARDKGARDVKWRAETLHLFRDIGGNLT
jgi:hypothetical protein